MSDPLVSENKPRYALYPRSDDRGPLGKFRELKFAYNSISQSGLALLATLVVYVILVSFKTGEMMRNMELLLLGICLLTFINCYLRSVVASAKVLDQSIPGNFVFALIVLLIPFGPLVTLISAQQKIRGKLAEYGITPTLMGFNQHEVEQAEQGLMLQPWSNSD